MEFEDVVYYYLKVNINGWTIDVDYMSIAQVNRIFTVVAEAIQIVRYAPGKFSLTKH